MAKALTYRWFLDYFLSYPIAKEKTTTATKNVSVTTVNTLYAEILAIDTQSLTVNCLLDEDTQTFQTRTFDIAPFIGMDLSVNDYLKIEVHTQKGERRFLYTKANSKKVTDKFKEIKLFQDLDMTKLFPKTQAVEDEDNF